MYLAFGVHLKLLSYVLVFLQIFLLPIEVPKGFGLKIITET